MKRELGHEVLLSSGRFRSAITAIVAIAERQLLERTWRDRGGGEGFADVGTIGVFSSAFQRRIRVVQAPDDMVRLGTALGEEIRAAPCAVVTHGERRAGDLQRCGRPRDIMPLAAAEREKDLC